MKNKELKLTIELVPSSLWYTSLKRRLSVVEWDRLRKKIYDKFNHRCSICGSNKKLDCHEVWEYDDKNHIQKLIGFVALCRMCHFVKHIGLAQTLALKGKLNYEDVVRHFMKVNKCDRNTFEKHKKVAFKQWRKRSKYKWQIDFGKYNKKLNG